MVFQTGNTVEKELIIHATASDVEIALLEDGKLVEIHRQKTNAAFSVGDIFLGQVRKIMPGLNATFVDIGHRKDAFLHYTDLGPKLPALLKFTDDALNGRTNGPGLDAYDLTQEIVKNGKIDAVLGKNQQVLIQVLKEPISTKGPRLSCEVTIPGRYVVLTPFSNALAVSKKIPNEEERKRLQILCESIKPKNFGLIVRTAAEGKKVADLHEEINTLMEKWAAMYEQLRGARQPKKLLSELDKTSSMLRDILNDDFSKIVIDDEDTFNSVKSYLHTFAPERTKIMSLHRGSKPIFDAYSVMKQIKSAFGKTATMNSGAYLVIESTEAMHVIDVNSGPKMAKNANDDAIYNINLEAAEEIARQLRLRDIGGLICIDFIDMKSSDHRRDLVNKMRDLMSSDRAQHTILPLSKFGLMEITRERVKPEVKINTAEVCPSCNGTGKVNPTILLTDDIERDIEFILNNRPMKHLHLHTHPYVFAFIKKGLPNLQMRWYLRFKKWIKVYQNGDFHINQYKFYDGLDDEIRLS